MTCPNGHDAGTFMDGDVEKCRIYPCFAPVEPSTSEVEGGGFVSIREMDAEVWSCGCYINNGQSIMHDQPCGDCTTEDGGR